MSAVSVRGALRVLRSPKLAVGLILTLAAYGVIATVVPQSSMGEARVAEWAAAHPGAEALVGLLGLHDAFGTAAFGALSALLALSVAACAYERSRRAIRLARGTAAGPPGGAPVLPATGHRSAGDALDACGRALREIGLRPRGASAPDSAGFVGGMWGLAGSPVFHWALFALIVTIGAGRLTRSEGSLALTLDRPKVDSLASYAQMDSGPWAGDRSGLTFEMLDLIPEHVVGGVPVGPAPLVRVSDGGRVVAESLVYPNHPLRHGAMLVHVADWGLSAVFRVVNPGGDVIVDAAAECVFDDTRPSGTAAAVFEADPNDPGAEPFDIVVEALAQTRTVDTGMEARRAVPADRRVLVSLVTSRSAVPLSSQVLRPGGSMALPAGARLDLIDVRSFAWVNVVDDRSVYPVYALFVLASMGLGVSVLVPYRGVRLVVEGSAEEGMVVRYHAHHSRRDPLFAETVEHALRTALGGSSDGSEGEDEA